MQTAQISGHSTLLDAAITTALSCPWTEKQSGPGCEAARLGMPEFMDLIFMCRDRA